MFIDLKDDPPQPQQRGKTILRASNSRKQAFNSCSSSMEEAIALAGISNHLSKCIRMKNLNGNLA